MVADASWAGQNKRIWRASADPVGQPIRGPDQCHRKFLNRFFIFYLDIQENPPKYVAESIAIGWH
jgi:hypothetical protein